MFTRQLNLECTMSTIVDRWSTVKYKYKDGLINSLVHILVGASVIGMGSRKVAFLEINKSVVYSLSDSKSLFNSGVNRRVSSNKEKWTKMDFVVLFNSRRVTPLLFIKLFEFG